MLLYLRGVAENFLNLVYPKLCVICGDALDPKDGLRLCRRCVDEIRPNPKPWCARCGRPVERVGKICVECRRRHHNFKRNYSAYLYDGVMKKSIHQFKYRGKIYLSKLFAKLLIAFLRENTYIIEEIDGIVPVPLSKRRLKEREYNQSDLLARPIAEEFSLPVLGALDKIRSTRPQSELGKEARANNIRGAFRARDRNAARGKTILLLDDVFTTGSTIDECSRTLLDAGAKGVFSLTLARGFA